ncbi:MAG: hypothetical protein MUE77_06465 [Sandarakinorhabdus sp.]|jgi:hypothetical protein|nr:hypothetical protein [Sandarakinorhabdus sp.]
MSEIRIEQFPGAGTDGRETVQMPVLDLTADCLTVASGAAAAASAPLDPKTRVIGIRASAGPVAVRIGSGNAAAVAGQLATAAAGASVNQDEYRFFAVPPALHGKADVRVAVIDR